MDINFQLSALEHELDYLTNEVKSMKENHHNFRKGLTKLRDMDKPYVEEGLKIVLYLMTYEILVIK